MKRKITKTDFERFCGELLEKFTVVAPTRKGTSSVYAYLAFDHVHSVKDIVLDYSTTMLSPKKVFAPDGEVVFEFRTEGGDVVLRDVLPEQEHAQILLGVHSCDIAALSCLDRVFEEVYKDPFYWTKRNNTVVIAMSCTTVSQCCFCNVVGSGPEAKAGYDILLTDIGESFFAESATAKGDTLLKWDYFQEAAADDERKKAEVLTAVSKDLSEINQGWTLPQGAELIDALKRQYDNKLWSEYFHRCTTCGSCNMVCPTCHCFAMIDRASYNLREGKRLRVWDSCHFERFARMAGGFEIRASKESRFKHRLYDKFFYTLIRYGNIFCVGCGRCIVFCQSEIDIRSALKQFIGR